MDADLHRALVDAAAPRGRPALFLDRDGTLIEERDYLADPDGVRLLPGVAATLNAFRGAGYALVLVTNQSGVGRGRFGWDAYDAVATRLRALLAEDGAALDAEFVCGHAPSPAACPWRKPGAGMIEEAARRLDIPLGRSLAVGDKASDLAAAAAAGVGSGILVLTGYGVSERDGLAALPTGFPVSVLPGLAALFPAGAVMRVLVVKLSSFGDVIHTFPALTDAVAARPDLTFDWLVDAAFAGLAAAHPAVGTVHEVAHRSLRWPPRRWPDLVRQLRTLRGAFRARRYDLVIDAQGLMKSAALARLAGAPVVGLDRNSAREPTASALYGRRVAVDRRLHAVERTRRLFADALGYDRPAAPGRFSLVARTEAARPYGLLMHAASWPSKLWPEANWRALAGRLSDHGASFVLPWGDAAERARAERIADGIPGARVLPDRLAGAELIALLGGARWAIGLDSGLMHLAAALDVPGIWLFGPTDPGLTGPYGPDQTVLVSDHAAAPCRLRRCTAEPDGLCCMRGIGLDRVVDAWAALLSVSGQPPSAER